jgi:hypothetical protein
MGSQFGMAELQDEAQYLQYRSLSALAVVSIILALLGLTAFLHPVLAVLSLAGGVVGLWAMRRTRLRAHELTGFPLACIAVLLSGVSAVGSIGLYTFRYLNEVPDGHIRVAFADLQPDPERPELAVSPLALKLDGQKVFVKGYVYPDGQKAGIKRFILVPDMGTCCFGGQPKLTDMIEVTLRDPLRVRYSYRRRGLAGILKVSTRKKPVSGVDGVYYQLDAYKVN